MKNANSNTRLFHPDEYASAVKDLANARIAGWIASGVIAISLTGWIYGKDMNQKRAWAGLGLAAGLAADVTRRTRISKELWLNDIDDVSTQSGIDRAYHALRPQAQLQMIASLDEEAQKPQRAIAPANSPSWAQSLLDCLEELGVSCTWEGQIVTPSFIRAQVRPVKPGVEKILKSAENIQVAIGFDEPPLISSQKGYIAIDIPREDRQFVSLWDYSPSCKKITLPIGIGIDAKLIELDVTNPDTCHVLVGGTTGSGKSVGIYSWICSLIQRFSPDELKLVLIDPKAVGFSKFEGIEWLWRPVVTEFVVEQTLKICEELVTEMESCYSLLKNLKCENISEYNQKAHSKIPQIVVIIDEFADIILSSKESKEALEEYLSRLGGKARAAGITLILATQRPEAGVVTPLIRSNLPARVAFKAASEADSEIILGRKGGGAHRLLGKGDLLCLGNGKLQRAQALYVDVNEFVATLGATESETVTYSDDINDDTEQPLSERAKKILDILTKSTSDRTSYDAIRKSRMWEGDAPKQDDLLAALGELLNAGIVRGTRSQGYSLT